PVDISYLDECCRGRVERTHASIWIPEEAADRHIDACECLVSSDVVRTVDESGGAAQADVHLLREVLAQRDRASWTREIARQTGNSPGFHPEWPASTNRSR